MPENVAAEAPEHFWKFVGAHCRIDASALQHFPANLLPEPARQLLAHDRDMTSTLAGFHGSPLRVEILQQREDGDTYLREVFLRTRDGNRIVEYGVIAIALTRFTPAQQDAIRTGEIPLGGLLHRFKIPFVSAPIAFFAVPAAGLAQTPLAGLRPSLCHGRLNRLTTPAGEPLAWIMEILPPAP
jgi:hypothetical protein